MSAMERITDSSRTLRSVENDRRRTLLRRYQLPEPEIKSPNSCHVLPSNFINCICLIGERLTFCRSNDTDHGAYSSRAKVLLARHRVQIGTRKELRVKPHLVVRAARYEKQFRLGKCCLV